MKVESLRPALEELERALAWASTTTGINGQRVVPTIQTKGKKSRCSGWFAPNRWSTREGTVCHEINFTAEDLNRDAIAIVSTAVHEVVHLWCHSLDIKDTAASGRHNKKFKEYAEILGLICADPSDSYGYGYTQPGPKLQKQIESEFKPDLTKLNLFRLAVPVRETASTKMQKWSCGCTTVRCARQLTAICEFEGCGNLFVVV